MKSIKKMHCIFNATFFPTSFYKNFKYPPQKNKKHERLCGCGAVPVCESIGGSVQAAQQPCVIQQGHHAASSPLGLQASTLQTSKLNVPL